MAPDQTSLPDPRGGASPWAGSPMVLGETGDFAVLYKPPFMHCAPLGSSRASTLLEWYGCIYPPALELKGKKPAEGGLAHRLDYETEGLVLVGKNQAALDALFLEQRQGLIVKEYSALTEGKGEGGPAGFPPSPFRELPEGSFFIRSFFRPWGPGRKAVRPVEDPLSRGSRDTAGDQGQPYTTEVLAREGRGGGLCFRLRLKRGFRHQIRCHLSWIGTPVLRDTLYGAPKPDADSALPFALRSRFISFPDPRTGAKREYFIPDYPSSE